MNEGMEASPVPSFRRVPPAEIDTSPGSGSSHSATVNGSSTVSPSSGKSHKNSAVTENQGLRAILAEKIRMTDLETVQSRSSSSITAVGVPLNTAALKEELGAVNQKILKIKTQIDRARQKPSIRTYEDRIADLNRRLVDVDTEIEAVSRQGKTQSRELNRVSSRTIYNSIQMEIQQEKKFHSELRRVSIDLESSLRKRERVNAMLMGQIEKNEKNSKHLIIPKLEILIEEIKQLEIQLENNE